MLFRSVRKCAKTGQTVACPGARRSPDDRYGLKIKGFLQGPKTDLFFLKNRDIPSQMPHVRQWRGSGIRYPPVDVTGVRHLLILFGSRGRRCHRFRQLTTGPVLNRPRVRPLTTSPAPPSRTHEDCKGTGVFRVFKNKKRDFRLSPPHPCGYPGLRTEFRLLSHHWDPGRQSARA